MLPPKIFVSNLSLAPRGMERALEIIVDAQLDGFQQTPLWWWRKPWKKFNPTLIASIEPPFWDRHQSLSDILEQAKCEDDMIGTIAGLLLFGFGGWCRTDAAVKALPGALPCDCKCQNSLLETSPRNTIYPTDYLTHPNGVVLDTRHIGEYVPGPIKIAADPVELTKELLDADQIKLVHVQLRDQADIDEFLQDKGLSHTLMTLVGEYHCQASVVIELDPRRLLRRPAVKLQKLAEHIRSYY